MKLFFGKISQGLGEQHENNFYAAGPKGNSWYNGLEVGDYVFPIFGGKVYKLWQVREYAKTPKTKKTFEDQAILFDVVRILEKPIVLSTQFCTYRFFDINLNLLNKSTKSTSSEKKGFFEITKTENCPNPIDINLQESRNVIIHLEETKFPFKENDISVLIKSIDNEYKIVDILIFSNGQLNTYQPLWSLYEQKNKDKYTLQELLKYALTDEAKNKKKYLNAVISDLDDQGYFFVSNPIALYDCILVGRKKYGKKKNKSEETIGDIEKEVDESNDDEKFDEYMQYVDLLNFNPNLILYGPPGTGKTYTAQKIVEAFEYKITKDPSINFTDIKKEGRVEFITFHQSYSYEEFVEGIRPVINIKEEEEVEEENEANGIRYEIKPGILRIIANNASLESLQENVGNQPLKEITKESRVYKISLGRRNQDDEIYNECKKDEIVSIGWFHDTDLKDQNYNYIYKGLQANGYSSSNPRNDASSINIFVNEVKKGDIVFIYDGPYTIRDIGIIIGDYVYDPNRNDYRHTRKVKWIKEFKKPFDIGSYNGNTKLTLKTIYPLDRIRFDDLAAIIGEEDKKIVKKKYLNPYFIIIDEINRGNISKIFGELITLIEKDKRDLLKLTLPYSQKPFTIPSNLFFIGTMNTADRSIAVLDTALRRRFLFKELEPNSEVIVNASENPIIEGKIDLAVLLDELNKKIEKLYDRDHRIGHSYFLDAVNIKTLRQVWYFQIIPLLQEYFYNDSDKVSKIVGISFFNKVTQRVNFELSNDEFITAILKICNNE